MFHFHASDMMRKVYITNQKKVLLHFRRKPNIKLACSGYANNKKSAKDGKA